MRLEILQLQVEPTSEPQPAQPSGGPGGGEGEEMSGSEVKGHHGDLLHHHVARHCHLRHEQMSPSLPLDPTSPSTLPSHGNNFFSSIFQRVNSRNPTLAAAMILHSFVAHQESLGLSPSGVPALLQSEGTEPARLNGNFQI